MASEKIEEGEELGKEWPDIVRRIARDAQGPVTLNISTRDGELVDPIAALSSEEGMKELLSLDIA